MLKIIHIYTIFICCLFSLHATAHPSRDTLSIQVTAPDRTSLQGAYVINKTKHYLITTTDREGKCQIPQGNITLTDSIQIAYTGYHDTVIAWTSLSRHQHIKLKVKTELLQEVQIKGIKPKQLIQSISEQLTPVKSSYILNFCGKAQYTKITLCNSKAVEFRNEIGCFFTSGNVKLKEKWDIIHHSYFIPVYSARSYNLTSQYDTLKITCVQGNKLEYDAGYVKIFNVIRSFQLWGPLYTKSKYYSIKLIDENKDYYTFSFATNEKYYPREVKILCRGTIFVQKRDLTLKRILIDYLDYHFYKLANMTRANSPFTTKAEIEFTCNESSTYIKTCQIETTWKHNFDKNYGSIEKPSRRNPARIHLIEKENFTIDSLQQILEKKQEKYLLQKVIVAACNPRGKYDSKIFKQISPIPYNSQILIELDQFQKIEQQFIHNSNRWYYPESKFLSLPLKTEQIPISINQFVIQIKNELLNKFYEQDLY